MDVIKYISSGILEAYVLGGVSPQERQEVECMSAIYPEIKEELVQLQTGFEKAAKEFAIDPPKELKSRIMDKIRSEKQDHINKDLVIESKSETKIVEMKSAKSSSILKMGMAASVAVILGLGYFLVQNQSELDIALADNRDNVVKLKEDIVSVENKLLKEENRNEYFASLNDLYSSETTQMISMPASGIEGLDENAKTRVFWNAEMEQVALEVDYLPAVPKGKQYQLWAIVDGSPADMGVFDLPQNGETLLIEFADDAPQAFAITLEDEGGKPSPDMTALFVVGNV